MKKVAIITINTDNNYGNRLQNYALQNTIEKLGFNVETIRNSTHDIKVTEEPSKIKRSIRKIRSILGSFKRKLNGTTKCNKDRKENFIKFDDKYVNYTKYTINKNNVPEKLKEEFDYFVIGSDQVWNPTFGRMSHIEFGLFAPKNKVVAYAASFGIDKIEDNLKEIYNKGLNNINYISVREEKGKELVKELSNRESQVVLDPTLLLTKDEWKKVINKPKKTPKRKYILTYFLGNISKERETELNKIAKKNKFDIINMAKMDYKKYYIAGPSEFLWYIQNAEIIFTDSFHGSVFSIIFDKTFYVMEREDQTVPMNSRIETLLTTFDLKERKFKNWNNVLLEHDYSQVDEILHMQQQKSLTFLKEALRKED